MNGFRWVYFYATPHLAPPQEARLGEGEERLAPDLKVEGVLVSSAVLYERFSYLVQRERPG